MIFCKDVGNPEGPVSISDGSWVVTEMNRGTVTYISANGQNKRILAKTGRPNGLALDLDHNLWVAESKFPALLKLTMAGKITTISSGNSELPFLWPNDLCFGPDGSIYMTDSGIYLNDMEGIDPPEAVCDVPIDGRVFRIDQQNGKCNLLDRGLRFANGIAFGPDGEYMYVNETLTGDIFRYKIVDGQVVGDRHLFGNVMIKPCPEFGCVAGPDGMAFDIEGNLYVTVLSQGDVTVLYPDGSVKERLEIDGSFPTNIAFGQPRKNYALVTEGSKNQLLMIDIRIEGLSLNVGKVPLSSTG